MASALTHRHSSLTETAASGTDTIDPARVTTGAVGDSEEGLRIRAVCPKGMRLVVGYWVLSVLAVPHHVLIRPAPVAPGPDRTEGMVEVAM